MIVSIRPLWFTSPFLNLIKNRVKSIGELNMNFRDSSCLEETKACFLTSFLSQKRTITPNFVRIYKFEKHLTNWFDISFGFIEKKEKKKELFINLFSGHPSLL